MLSLFNPGIFVSLNNTATFLFLFQEEFNSEKFIEEQSYLYIYSKVYNFELKI